MDWWGELRDHWLYAALLGQVGWLMRYVILDYIQEKRRFAKHEANSQKLDRILALLVPTFPPISPRERNFMTIESIPLPYHAHRLWQKPNEVIWHHTAGTSLSGALSALHTNKLSYHYLIDLDGIIYKLVEENRVAYHAGVWTVNLKSIGVALVGHTTGFTDAQYASGQELWRDLQTRHKLTGSRTHQAAKGKTKQGLWRTECPGQLELARLMAVIPPVDSPSPEFPKLGLTINYTNGGLTGGRLREAPNTSSRTIRVLPNGTKVNAYERVAGEAIDGYAYWLRVDDGYVWERLIP